MPINFNGTSDYIQIANAGGTDWGPFTVAVIARKLNTDTPYMGMVSAEEIGSPGSRWEFYASNAAHSNALSFYDGEDDINSSIPFVVSDGWCLLAMTFNGDGTGPGAPYRLHKYVYSTNTWSHADTAQQNEFQVGSTAGGANKRTSIGCGNDTSSNFDFFNGDIAVVAIWGPDGNLPSDKQPAYARHCLADSQIESLPHSLAAWVSLYPHDFFILDQSATTQKVKDLTYGVTESTRSGTTISTASVPVFTYGAQVSGVTKSSAVALPTPYPMQMPPNPKFVYMRKNR